MNVPTPASHPSVSIFLSRLYWPAVGCFSMVFACIAFPVIEYFLTTGEADHRLFEAFIIGSCLLIGIRLIRLCMPTWESLIRWDAISTAVLLIYAAAYSSELLAYF